MSDLTEKKQRKKTVTLSDEERFEVLRMMGTHATNEDIRTYLTSVGKEVSQVNRVLHFYRHSDKFRPLIEKFRAQYESRMMDIAITSKRYRLQRLEQMFNACYKEGKMELAAKMLDRARDEVEGKTDGRPNIFITQFNQLTDTEIEEKKLKIMSTLERMRKSQMNQLEVEYGMRAKETQQTADEVIDIDLTKGEDE